MLARLLAPQIDALVERLRRLARLLVALLSAVWLGGLAVSFLGVLVIIAAWDTAWRIPAAAGVALLLCVALALVVLQVQRLMQQGDQSFALLKRELAADLETLRRMRDDTAPDAPPEPPPTPEGPDDAPRP